MISFTTHLSAAKWQESKGQRLSEKVSLAESPKILKFPHHQIRLRT